MKKIKPDTLTLQKSGHFNFGLTRISHDRAAIELKLLNKRQKGGWLKDKISFLKND